MGYAITKETQFDTDNGNDMNITDAEEQKNENMKESDTPKTAISAPQTKTNASAQIKTNDVKSSTTTTPVPASIAMPEAAPPLQAKANAPHAKKTAPTQT